MTALYIKGIGAMTFKMVLANLYSLMAAAKKASLRIMFFSNCT
jgi:5,10-methylene-tetrahydrofolate dehydrogenase/methenyl tetrahydrofolate cyclohydrolase